ncbi:S-phase kinase-associated protein 2 [Drosophila nasuta]|uniref:S-phase kinase-associated protein 2 n=1 Tax=Drosophila nasuta TaxID=42062 RepID=UPI00295ED0D5|nr:S-phase kinase-associated protein 2 [Drosophila nasuta]
MSSRKHRGAENIENLCPVSRKRSSSKNSAVGIGATTSKAAPSSSTASTSSSIYEYTSSPSVLTYEALEEMGIGMLDSEESSSSAMSAIALAVSATSDENSNETTPCATIAARMLHQHQQQSRLSLNSTGDHNNSTLVELCNEDSQEQRPLSLSQAKRTALANNESPAGSNSNSPSKRTRNPLATVTCNQQSEAPQQTLLPPPPQQPQQQTPLSLLPSTSKQALLRQQKKPTPVPRLVPTQNFFVYRTPAMSAHISSGINYFEQLSDEILLDIFRWLPKKALLRIATVCRRFNCCARDETLWTRLDLGLRTIRPSGLEHVVRRSIPVLRLAQADIQDPAFSYSPTAVDFHSRLQYLDLSLASISLISLQTLLTHCRQLKKLSLEHAELNDEICFEIAQNTSLETLNLSMASGLNASSVRLMMESLSKLNSLNISWTDLSADAVTALVTHVSPNIIRLNAAGCRRVLFDSHVLTLHKRCKQLLELDLSDCNSLTPAALATIMKFTSLEYLSVSRCYLIPATNFIELKNMSSLTYLDIFGMLSEAAMEVLEKQMPKIGINKFIHSSVGRPTVGTRRTSIWGIRTRD